MRVGRSAQLGQGHRDRPNLDFMAQALWGCLSTELCWTTWLACAKISDTAPFLTMPEYVEAQLALERWRLQHARGS